MPLHNLDTPDRVIAAARLTLRNTYDSRLHAGRGDADSVTSTLSLLTSPRDFQNTTYATELVYRELDDLAHLDDPTTETTWPLALYLAEASARNGVTPCTLAAAALHPDYRAPGAEHRITDRVLAASGACLGQRWAFWQVFPDGVSYDEAAALSRGDRLRLYERLNVDYALVQLLGPTLHVGQLLYSAGQAHTRAQHRRMLTANDRLSTTASLEAALRHQHPSRPELEGPYAFLAGEVERMRTRVETLHEDTLMRGFEFQLRAWRVFGTRYTDDGSPTFLWPEHLRATQSWDPAQRRGYTPVSADEITKRVADLDTYDPDHDD